jgi:hypothetical protein
MPRISDLRLIGARPLQNAPLRPIWAALFGQKMNKIYFIEYDYHVDIILTMLLLLCGLNVHWI